jgi:hypothetical protein
MKSSQFGARTRTRRQQLQEIIDSEKVVPLYRNPSTRTTMQETAPSPSPTRTPIATVEPAPAPATQMKYPVEKSPSDDGKRGAYIGLRTSSNDYAQTPQEMTRTTESSSEYVRTPEQIQQSAATPVPIRVVVRKFGETRGGTLVNVTTTDINEFLRVANQTLGVNNLVRIRMNLTEAIVTSLETLRDMDIVILTTQEEEENNYSESESKEQVQQQEKKEREK